MIDWAISPDKREALSEIVSTDTIAIASWGVIFLGIYLLRELPADLLRRYRQIREERERRRARINAEEWKKVETHDKAKEIVRMYQPDGIEYEAMRKREQEKTEY